MKTAFRIVVIALGFFYLLGKLGEAHTVQNECGKWHNGIMIPCEPEVRNECIGETGESLERCLLDKKHDLEILSGM